MKPVLFSVSYAGLWGQHLLDLEGFVHKAASLGYAGVEIMCKRPHLSPLDWDEARAQKLAGVCAGAGVSIECLGAYTDFSAGGTYPEIPLAEFQIRYVENVGRLAAAMGCPLVRVFTSYENDRTGFVPQWNQLVACLRECAERLAPLGVRLGVQNHHDLAVHTKAMRELLLDVNHPNCAMMLDPWSPCLRGEPLYDTAREHAPHIVYSTFADYVRLPRHRYEPALVNYNAAPLADWVKAVPFGEGEIDNHSWLRGLRDGGFDGPVCYEMCSPLRGGGSEENLDRCAKKFLEWMTRESFILPPR